MELDALAQELFACTRILRRGPMKELHALSGGELCVLDYLSEQSEAVTPTVLSGEFRISTARVANVLNSLERKGYIRREQCQSDRRRVYVFVTEAGRTLARQERENALAGIRRTLTALGTEDAETYLRITRKLLTLIQAQEAENSRNEKSTNPVPPPTGTGTNGTR